MKRLVLLLTLAMALHSYAQTWDFDRFNPIKSSVKLRFNPAAKADASFKKLDSAYQQDPKTLFFLGHSEFSSDLAQNNILSKNNSGHLYKSSSSLGKPAKVYHNTANNRSITVDNHDLPQSITIPNGKKFISDLHKNDEVYLHGAAWKYYTYNPQQKKLVLEKIVLTKEFQSKAVATYFAASKTWSFGSTSGKLPFPACNQVVAAPSVKPQLNTSEAELKKQLTAKLGDLSTLNGQAFFTCKVNCKGQLADIAVMRVMGLNAQSKAIQEVLAAKTHTWTAAQHNGAAVDSKLTVAIRVSRGVLSIKK